jgi:ribosomal protein L39E
MFSQKATSITMKSNKTVLLKSREKQRLMNKILKENTSIPNYLLLTEKYILIKYTCFNAKIIHHQKRKQSS